jgi:GT2 family glycosyltransferase
MNGRALVSIIILNYNGGFLLRNCLLSVLETDYPLFEVIVVDNASTDGSLELALGPTESRKMLKIVRNHRNMGFGPANNIGYEHSNGDYIVFLNNDTIVDPSWLTAMVDAMERDQTIGLAQSLILDYSSHEVQTAGWLMSDYFVALFPIRIKSRRDLNRLPDVFEISYAQGASMMVRREVVNEVGLFDPKYFWFYDDTYLSFKAWLAGKRVVTVAKSKVYHLGGGTAGYDSFLIRWRNTVHFTSLIFDTYWDLLDLFSALFIFSLNLEITTVKEILEHHKTTRFWSNFYAVGWVLKNLRYIWKKRLEYLMLSKVTQKVLLSKMIRVHLPSSLYLVPSPSKLLWHSLTFEAERYKKDLVFVKNRNLE